MPDAEQAAGGGSAGWGPDILGTGYEQLTLDLPGGAPATLVRYTPPGGPGAAAADVLYVHGWSDYFFQREFAEYWAGAGARFYALDLHNYGRSLRPGQTPGYAGDLAEYDDDIAAALAVMGQPDPGMAAPGQPGDPAANPARRSLILTGHSTGGLTLSLWAARHPSAASALVLNSPWLEFQATELGRRVISPLIGLEAQRRPLAPLPPVDVGNYSRAVFSAFGGEWTYNLQWRPLRGFPVTVAFLNAVFRAQGIVAEGLHLEIPVLVLLSDKSYLQPRWSADAGRSDVALDVNVVAHRALSLGSAVTVARITDALHDVFLSEPSVRSRAYGAVARWSGGYLPDLTPRAAGPGAAAVLSRSGRRPEVSGNRRTPPRG